MIDADSIDWTKAGETFSRIQSDLMHGEGSELRGAEFYGEALRRLFARIGHNWVTSEESQRAIHMSTSISRSNAEQAKAALHHFTEEYQRKLADARAVMADAIRTRCNEVTVPSRYRREGVLLAAEWLDGKEGGTP